MTAAILSGLFVPWIPAGVSGIDLTIASSTAAIGVMDWVLFQYAALARGRRPGHERLARVDIGIGLLLPFLLVNYLVIEYDRDHAPCRPRSGDASGRIIPGEFRAGRERVAE